MPQISSLSPYHLINQPIFSYFSTEIHHFHGEPISLLKALLLPGVLAYCICNACLKLVNYAFFFWLPLYLTDAYHWEESQADQLSIWYDFGGIIGSVLGGYITDKMGKRSPLIVAMLVCSIGSLYFYAHVGPYMFWNALVMTTVGVTVSGPYNLIVGSISIDLGSQPALAGNTQAMSTVSGLLDGTGSAGSAVGQLLIPIIQDDLGWKAVFYVFMLLVRMTSESYSLLNPIVLPERFRHSRHPQTLHHRPEIAPKTAFR